MKKQSSVSLGAVYTDRLLKEMKNKNNKDSFENHVIKHGFYSYLFVYL